MAASSIPTPVPSTHKPFAFIQVSKAFIITALLCGMYIRVMVALADEWWTNPAASHGMLIPPIAAWVTWMRRDITFSRPALADIRGLLGIAIGCLLFLIGTAGAEFFLTRLSLIVLLGGLVWVFWGLDRLTTLAFPLILLVTMIPLPAIVYNALASPLQLLSSDVATRAAQAAGIAAYRDGNVIQLATIQLGIVEACSGLNSLSSLVVASLLLGFLNTTSFVVRVLLVVLSVPLAVAVNVIRVSGTAILADYHPEAAMGFYHSFSGWLVFLIGFSSLWCIGKALQFSGKSG
jgi:exosortase